MQALPNPKQSPKDQGGKQAVLPPHLTSLQPVALQGAQAQYSYFSLVLGQQNLA